MYKFPFKDTRWFVNTANFILIILACSLSVLIFILIQHLAVNHLPVSLQFFIIIAILLAGVSITIALILRKQKLINFNYMNEIRMIHISEEKLKMLVSSATRMLQIREKETILKFITESLHERYPGTIILFFVSDLKRQKIRISAASGFNKNLIQKLTDISDSDNFNYRLSPAIKEDIKSGEFIQYNGGLRELFEDQIPSGIINDLDKITGSSEVAVIGANWDDSVLSWITILTSKSEIKLDTGFITAFVKQASIILQQKRVESTLEESEWQFKLLLNSAAEGIYGINLSGNCIICNNKALQLLGYTSTEEVLGKNMHELIHHSYPDGTQMSVKDCKIFKAFTDGKEIHSEDEVFFRRDGSSLPVEYWSYPLKHDEIVTGAVITFFDITEKKKVLKEKRQNEANLEDLNQKLLKTNATKNRLFSIIAHDLRNPVTSTVSFTEMLIENIGKYDNEKLTDHLNLLKTTTCNTLELLDNLLLWSRSQVDKFEFHPQPIRLKPFVARLIEEMKPNADLKKIELRHLTLVENEFFSDPAILKIIIRNLMQNALKYTNEGGTIEIDDILTDGAIQISVTDNGVGMSQQLVESLFDNEFNNSNPGTARERGSGLGLILCKEFVDKLGGDIRAESELGRGSRFVLTLPLSGCVIEK